MENNFIILPATERENFLLFHELAFKEDLGLAKKLVVEYPRWSIIIGYYSMHDITKFYLGKKFNVKIGPPNVHGQAILALEHFIPDPVLKSRVMKLLREAKDIYFDVERLKEKALPALLKKGRQDRAKSQYYTSDFSKKSSLSSNKAEEFLKKIVEPYVRLIGELMF